MNRALILAVALVALTSMVSAKKYYTGFIPGPAPKPYVPDNYPGKNGGGIHPDYKGDYPGKNGGGLAPEYSRDYPGKNGGGLAPVYQRDYPGKNGGGIYRDRDYQDSQKYVIGGRGGTRY